jgi:hypothetical protein
VDIAAHAENAWKNHKSQLHSPIMELRRGYFSLTLRIPVVLRMWFKRQS